MSVLHHMVDHQLLSICRDILLEDKSLKEWEKLASEFTGEDYYELENYSGGFNVEAQAFCFTYYDQEGEEYWFQLTLDEVQEIDSGNKRRILMRPAYPQSGRSLNA